MSKLRWVEGGSKINYLQVSHVSSCVHLGEYYNHAVLLFLATFTHKTHWQPTRSELFLSPQSISSSGDHLVVRNDCILFPVWSTFALEFKNERRRCKYFQDILISKFGVKIVTLVLAGIKLLRVR